MLHNRTKLNLSSYLFKYLQIYRGVYAGLNWASSRFSSFIRFHSIINRIKRPLVFVSRKHIRAALSFGNFLAGFDHIALKLSRIDCIYVVITEINWHKLFLFF